MTQEEEEEIALEKSVFGSVEIKNDLLFWFILPTRRSKSVRSCECDHKLGPRSYSTEILTTQKISLPLS